MNLDIVEHLQKMEKTLTSMDREKESLRAEIQNVEKRVQGCLSQLTYFIMELVLLKKSSQTWKFW